MKRLIFSLAALVCGSAMAAGQFDGVYQSTSTPEQFYSIHQNGNILLLTSYGAIPTDGNIFLRYGSDQFRPSKIYLWEVQTGEINGTSAIMSGGTMQNACTLTYQLDLTPAKITATIIKMEQRLGGVQCGQLVPAGTSVTANRMF